MAVSTLYTVERFQQQYGSLWRTVERYLDGTMPEEQRCGVELVVDPQLIAAVAQTRLLQALVAAWKRKDDALPDGR
jgi:hypothetical protein